MIQRRSGPRFAPRRTGSPRDSAGLSGPTPPPTPPGSRAGTRDSGSVTAGQTATPEAGAAPSEAPLPPEPYRLKASADKWLSDAPSSRVSPREAALPREAASPREAAAAAQISARAEPPRASRGLEAFEYKLACKLGARGPRVGRGDQSRRPPLPPPSP